MFNQKKSVNPILSVQTAMPCILKNSMPVFWKAFLFSKNEFADSDVNRSIKLTWCLDFPCVICFTLLLFCRKADMDFGKIRF